MCKKIFLLDGENFYTSKKSGSRGFRHECKDCRYPDVRNHKTIEARLIHYKDGAKRRGIDFALTKDQFSTFWKKPCFYCGDNIETIGLDRIDNSTGYTVKNIVPCCSICNKMKLGSSQEDFFERCGRIALFR